MGIFSLSKGATFANSKAGKREIRAYSLYCFFFAGWCFLSVGASFTTSDFWMHVLFYLSEFFKFLTFSAIFEIIGFLTKYKDKSRFTINRISTAYLYGGLVILFIYLVVGKTELRKGYHGVFFTTNAHIIELSIVLYYLAILFGMFYLILAFHEECILQREKYAFGSYVGIIIVMFFGMILELCGFFLLGDFIPSVLIACALLLFMINYSIDYKNSIEYNEIDYEEELSPTNPRAICICDDDGKILYLNKRLIVMSENNRDDIKGKNLFDVFSITNEDKRRALSYKGKDSLDVKATYVKAEEDVVLGFVHKSDRFGNIFSMIVSVTPMDEYIEENDSDSNEILIKEAEIVAEVSEPEEDTDFEVTPDDIKAIQIENLISIMKNAEKLYRDNKREIFEYNLNAIKKSASLLGFPSVEELAERMSDACLFNDWESIEPMLIEIDRQCETIKAII